MLPRCLNIPEIQLLLCEELGQDKANRKSLVDLSLTNKQFQEVALNQLWRTQTSLFPLFKCFPSDSWSPQTLFLSAPPGIVESEDSDVVEVESLVFIRYILQKDWRRVSFYARRIHVLDAGWKEFDAFQRDFWQILSASLPTDMNCLLPELKQLRYPDTDTPFHTFNLFISPRLQDLTLSISRSFALRLTTFQSLPELSPSLTTLVINDYSPGTFHALKPALAKFTALRNLTMGSIRASTLIWIFQYMTTLETLDVLFSVSKQKKLQENPVQQSRLHTLRRVTLRNIQMCMVPQVITPFDSDSLTEIKIHAICGDNEENWAETFAALRQFANSLESVKITDFPPTSPYNDIVLTHRTFEDILALSKLKRLRISTKSQVSLSDDFIRRLGESCRRLRLLEIQGNSRIPDITPTLNGLLPFLRHCQDLNHLSLYIDASQNQYDPSPSNHQVVVNKSLTSLHVGYSPIFDTVSIATFLAIVTPSLQEIQCTGSYYRPLWRQTVLHLRVARNLRNL